MPYMLGTQITAAFEKRGWARKSGGELYFDGKGGADHLHPPSSSKHDGPSRSGGSGHQACGKDACLERRWARSGRRWNHIYPERQCDDTGLATLQHAIRHEWRHGGRVRLYHELLHSRLRHRVARAATSMRRATSERRTTGPWWFFAPRDRAAGELTSALNSIPCILWCSGS